MKPTIFLLVPFLATTAFGQTPGNNPDIRVDSTGTHQLDPRISVNPSNSDHLMLVMNSGSWFFSTNSGLVWSGSENAPPGLTNQSAGAVCSFAASGWSHYATLGPPGGVLVVSTSDLGTTWTQIRNADPLSSTNDDAAHLSSDVSAIRPNNLYAAWTDFGISSAPVVFTRSTDQGQTWSSRQSLAIGSNRGQGVHIAIGPNGEVYVVWAHYTTGTQEAGLGFAKSTDGGFTFTTPAVAYPFTGIRVSNSGIPALNNTRASSYPDADVDRSQWPRRGWIYVVHPELVSGQADVFLHRSTDGGATWSSGIRVNGPDVEQGKWQWMASMGVDPATGDITVSYNSMDSTGSNYMTNRYAAHSTDGGNTWERWVISDVRFLWSMLGTPQTQVNPGTKTATVALGGIAWSAWTDARTGYSQTWLERIDYGSIDTGITIISPNGGEIWLGGETHSLIWKEIGIDTVTIMFSYTGSGGPWQILRLSYSGRDTLPFVVPPGPTSNDCFFRVSWKSHPAVFDTNDAPFTIDYGPANLWQVQSSGITTSLFAVKAISPSIGWVAGVSGVRRTTNGGNTWTNAGTFGADVYSLTALDAYTAFVTVNTTIARTYRTTNGGLTWTPVDSVTSTGAFYDAVEMNSPTTGLVIGDPVAGNWLMRRTTNTGSTWFSGPTVPWISSEGIWTNCLTWYDSLDGWFFTSPGSIYRTSSGGATWNRITPPSSPGPVWFNQLTLGLSGPGLRSTDAGASWTQTQGTIPGTTTGLSGIRGSPYFWATAGHSVYYTSNGGDSWSNSAPDGYTGTDYLNAVSFTYDGSIWAGWAVGMSGTIVHFIAGGDDVEPPRSDAPLGFSLSQNYPNPFNPTTTIRYSLSSQERDGVRSQRVLLRVYDVLGREVATLVNEEKPPGRYQIRWDARSVASGVYYYRLQAGNLSAVRKLLIVK